MKISKVHTVEIEVQGPVGIRIDTDYLVDKTPTIWLESNSDISADDAKAKLAVFLFELARKVKT